jgi:hypothetical protein
MFHMFGALAESERDLIRGRTQAGLVSPPAHGVATVGVPGDSLRRRKPRHWRRKPSGPHLASAACHDIEQPPPIMAGCLCTPMGGGMEAEDVTAKG